MCRLKEGSKPDRATHPSVCDSTLNIFLVSPLFSFKQGDYSKESSIGRREGLSNSSRGIKGEHCTSQQWQIPHGTCRKLLYGVKKLVPRSAAATQLYQSLTKYLKGAWHVDSLNTHCSLTLLYSRERDELNESHKEDLNSSPQLQIEALRYEDSGIQIRN